MQVTIDLPEEIGRRVRCLPDPSRFVAEALARAFQDRPGTPQPPPRPRLTFLDPEEHRSWAAEMRATFGLRGEPLSVEEIQQMGQESGLKENEMSRGIIEAREE